MPDPSPRCVDKVDTNPVAVKDAGSTNKLDRQPNKVPDDNEEDLEAKERKRAVRKSKEDGIRVVSAFEGEYTFMCTCYFVVDCDTHTVFRICLRCWNARGRQASRSGRL